MILDSVKLTNETNTKTYYSYNYQYDRRGNVKNVTEDSGYQTSYAYDGLDRVITEKVITTNNTIDKHLQYEYNKNGQLQYVKDINNGASILKSFSYNNGKLSSAKINGVTKKYIYDNYGNPISIGEKPLSWIRGNLLKTTGTTTYTYNHLGVRTSKNSNNINVTYYVDGGKLLGEDRSDGTQIRYFYDGTGITGFTYNDTIYYYGKDGLGNVRKILDENKNIVGEYNYDAFGNTTNALTATAKINPIRYKCFYYDSETNWYYINGRYYDPDIGQYITVSVAEELLNPVNLQSWNRYLLSYNNPISILGNSDKIYFESFVLIPNYWLELDIGLPEWFQYVIWPLSVTALVITSIINPAAIPGIVASSLYLSTMAFFFTFSITGTLARNDQISWIEAFEIAGSLALNVFLSVMLSMCMATISDVIAKKLYDNSVSITQPEVKIAAPANQAEHIQLENMTPYEKGIMGEKFISQLTGLEKNTRIYRLRFNDKGRIPDFMDKKRKILIESKNVKYQGLTKQLKDYTNIAKELGYSMELYVRKTTILSETLQRFIVNNGIIINYFPW